LDAHELLYATISHYYASLCQQQQKSEIALGNARDKNVPRINGIASDAAEQQSLEQLHRTLCTPGTRTMLLLADKSEIVANLKRREISEVKPERQSRANQREGEVEEEKEEEEEEEEEETKNDQQLLMTSSQYEADVEADENSDLESEHSLRGHRLHHHHHHHHKPSSRRSLLAGASHRLTTTTATTNSSSASNQQDRHQDFCCPSSGINSSMSEDCLTASLRGDDLQQQQQGPPPPPAPSPAPMVGEHCSRKLPASASSAAADNCYQQKSRGYRICRLMSCGGGGESSALATSTKTRSTLPLGGIKMGLRGHRSAVMDNNKNRSSIPKEEEEEEDEDESLIAGRKAASSKSSKTVRHFLNGFDHYLEEALQRQQTFWRRMRQQPQQQQNKITEGERKEEKGGEERLLSVLGIEQQIVGSVTFYKSYRLTGIKVIELALISVRRQYQGAGIGSHLLRAVKQSGQIGPYDAIRVKVPSSNSVLFDFFLANDFSDDLILNASFDQLDSVCSDEGDRDDVGDGDDPRENPFALFSSEVLGRRGGGGPGTGSLARNGIDRRASPSPSPMSHLGHSLSFDGFGNGSPMTTSVDHHRFIFEDLWSYQSGGTPGTSSASASLSSGKSCPSKQKKWWTSLCYLPPFSVATSLCSRDYHHGTTSLNSHHHHQRPPSSSSLVGQLDNRYVDELIEEANGVWRRDLLAAYRTQWSCVGRLRAEIARLRTVIVDAEQSIETLQRENLQLRARLRQCKSETTAQLNAQKHLFLLKNFNFDSLDF
ncbi:hypothetical protein TYRP_018189, partial [Tyrophagus putrescentiae]